jgi:polyhydroxyalkanoate synthesis regulator phasin
MAGPKQERTRTQRIVNDLAKRGESRAKDIQKTVREIAERSDQSRKELGSLIQKEIRRQIRALGLATRDDVERVQRRVRDLEKGGGTRRAAPKARASARAKKSTGH